MKNIKHIYSLNFNKVARSPKKITYLIFHYTGMKSESRAVERLLNKKSKVSCHYFIKKKWNNYKNGSGQIYCMARRYFLLEKA